MKNFAEIYGEPSSANELRRTVRVSIFEGAFAQIFTTLAAPGSVLLTKLAIFLGATPMHFGLMSAVGQLSQLFQLYGAAATQNVTSRKKHVVWFAGIGRLLVLGFGVLPFFFENHWAMWTFLLILFVSAALQAASANAWVAWVADMVPLRIRGRFWSKRNQVLMVVGLITGYIFGFAFDVFDSKPASFAAKVASFSPFFTQRNLPVAFLGIFAFATVMGIIGILVLCRQPEKPKPADGQKFIALMREPLADSNFRKLLLYGLWWMLAVGIGAPFWQPYMFGVLKMSIVEAQVYGTISTIAALGALKVWGEIIDRFGNKTAMRYAIILGGINPLLWLFATQNSYWVVYFEAATSGIMWSGANIIATNFVLAVAPPEKRQIYSAVYGAFAGAAMMVSMFLSGAFLPPPITIFGLALLPEQVLFALTGILRFTAQIPLSFIDEPRAKPPAELLVFVRDFFKVRILDFFNPSSPQ